MKVFLVAGARPNFMKIAPIYRASLAYGDVDCQIIHTGQHYDYEMSQAFFEDLEIPKPQYFLDAGSGPHAVQTAKIMVAFEEGGGEGREGCADGQRRPSGGDNGPWGSLHDDSREYGAADYCGARDERAGGNK